MTRKINQAGLDLIIRWEGNRLTAYQDGGGVWTIGVGHTSAAGAPSVSKGMKITKEQSMEILQNDITKWCAQVEKAVKVPLTDNQFAVLVSFTHNLGIGALSSSTLLRKLNAGQYDAVPSELMKWVHDNGKRVQGLVNRRQAEADLWKRPDSTSANQPSVVPDKEPEKPVESQPQTKPQEPKGNTLVDLIVALLQRIFGKS